MLYIIFISIYSGHELFSYILCVGAMTLSIIILGIKGSRQSAYEYADCQYAECCSLFVTMLSVGILNVMKCRNAECVGAMTLSIITLVIKG